MNPALPGKAGPGRRQRAARELRRPGDATDAEEAVSLRAVLHAHEVSLHRGLSGQRYGPRLARLRQHLSRRLRRHARQPGISERKPLGHRSAGTAAAAGDSDRRDVRRRRHVRSESELQDLPPRTARRRTLPRYRHRGEIQRRPAAGSGAAPQTGNGIVWKRVETPGTVTIPKAGIYQVDIYTVENKPAAPDASHLNEGLAGEWPVAGRMEATLSWSTPRWVRRCR